VFLNVPDKESVQDAKLQAGLGISRRKGLEAENKFSRSLGFQGK
jgi:hypothetical protein